MLTDAGFPPDEDGICFFSKDISKNSRNTQRINGRPVNAGISKELISSLITIHGQNDTHSLFNPKNHIKILDSFAKNTKLLDEYSEIYTALRSIQNKINELQQNDSEKLRRADMLRFQANEIRAAKLKPGEEDALLEKKKILLSFEKIAKNARIAYKAIYSNEKGASATDLLSRALTSVEALTEFYPELSDCPTKINDMISELTDIAERVTEVMPDSDENPTALLDKLETRLELIERTCRKYGSTEADVLDYLNKINQELDEMENSGDRLLQLQDEFSRLNSDATKLAEKISQTRIDAAKNASSKICEVLTFLDMPSVRFEVSVTRSDDLLPDGFDTVEFLVSPNPGEPLLPMARIASGGELARIMLAIKSVLTESDRISTVIFDEIDTGISGKTSRKVGIKLKELSRHAQVICVTHSAQIASLADTHIKISKNTVNGRAETSVKVLTDDERIEEIARILGGINITESQKNTASELISEGRKLYK
jgi:DNA repair protein RecN (Recombination protein N)